MTGRFAGRGDHHHAQHDLALAVDQLQEAGFLDGVDACPRLRREMLLRNTFPVDTTEQNAGVWIAWDELPVALSGKPDDFQGPTVVDVGPSTTLCISSRWERVPGLLRTPYSVLSRMQPEDGGV